jgi:hypothetical protein
MMFAVSTGNSHTGEFAKMKNSVEVIIGNLFIFKILPKKFFFFLPFLVLVSSKRWL